MSKNIVALYDDIVIARQVVEDLVKEDFLRASISLITNDAQNQYSHYLDKGYAPKTDAVSAAEGVGFGVTVGVLVGVLVGVASLTIPGVGLVVVAGPIVAGLTGAVLGTITGGIVGVLIKSGVPENDASYYAEGIRRGGTLVSIETSNILAASDIMNRYGVINVHERSNQWRQDGWKDADAVIDDNPVKSDSSVSITSDAVTTRVTHLSHKAPIQAPIEEECSDRERNTDVVQPVPVLTKVTTISPDTPVQDMPSPVLDTLSIEEPAIDEFDTEKIIPIRTRF